MRWLASRQPVVPLTFSLLSQRTKSAAWPNSMNPERAFGGTPKATRGTRALPIPISEFGCNRDARDGRTARRVRRNGSTKKETGGCLRRPPGNTFVSAGRQAESPTRVGRMQVGLVAPAMMTGAVGLALFRFSIVCVFCMARSKATGIPSGEARVCRGFYGVCAKGVRARCLGVGQCVCFYARR